MPTAKIRGLAQLEAAYHDRPFPLSRRRAALEAWSKQRHGGTAAGERLRQPPRLLSAPPKLSGRYAGKTMTIRGAFEWCRGERSRS